MFMIKLISCGFYAFGYLEIQKIRIFPFLVKKIIC